MSYRTILVHVDDSKNSDARIELSAELARREDAHLIGFAVTGISRFFAEIAATDVSEPSIQPYLDILKQRAEHSLASFEKIVRRVGVSSYEQRLSDDDASAGLSLQARYGDLVILGQYAPEEAMPTVYSDLPEYVVMNGGCPVLVVPYAGTYKSAGERVLIAWNGSPEASKAVRNAIPLLCRAKIVEVAVFNPSRQEGAHGEQPGADIATFLTRHNIKVDVMQEQTETDVGDALLSLAANLNSDLLVMGCYGHSRFRELLLGGVTRTMLRSMTIPVLMSH